MKSIGLISLALIILFALVLSAGCSLRGGSSIRLDGLSLGAVTMGGKSVTGLPSDKISLVLEVSAEQVSVTTSADGTTLTLNPSGATVEIKDGSVVIKGVKPDQMKVEWATTAKK